MNESEEIWVKIIDYPNYLISNHGFVKSLVTSLLLKPGYIRGYPHVCLYNKNGRKPIAIHRLVAIYFVNGYSEVLQVNHKDGNKVNNHYYNLEWITPRENINHAFKTGLMNPPKGIDNYQSKPIRKFSLDDIPLKDYVCTNDVKKDGFNRSNVGRVALGKRKTAGGFKWKFIN